MLSNRKIGIRLLFCFTVIAALTVLLALIAVVRMTQTGQMIAEEKRIRMSQLAVLYEIRGALNQTGLAARNAYIYQREDDAMRELDLLDEQRAIYMRSLEQLEPILGGRADFDKASRGLRTMATELSRPRQYRSAGQMAEFGTFLVEECSPLRRQIVADLKLVIGNIEAQLDQAAARVDSVLARSTWVVISIAAMAIVVGAALAYFVTLSITRPLGNAARLAEQVASGDLRVHVDTGGKDEIGALLRALGNMSAGLVGIVNGVREGTAAIAVSSREIATGNQDLSARTEAQASSLQRTANTMEMLTRAVGRNAEDARSASALAAEASAIASRGGTVVGQVIATMDDINRASGQIVDIIAVIDGIAFQTNILALNAAVEAARAGAQGRGFAVVATEVRQLAQRCSNAALEIKKLIHASVAKIEDGTTLVDQCGATMNELLRSVREVNTLIERIAAASDEQATSVRDINAAVLSVENMTQQNSSLVEQAAAATETMHGQAQELSSRVSRFRVA